jgi:3-oxoacyl-(acyl-carrier-protein) synthase
VIQPINKKSSAVITGMGCISAAGRNVEEHSHTIEQGERNCKQVPAWLFKTQQEYPVYPAPQDALTETGYKLLADVGTSVSNHSMGRTAQLMLSAVAEAMDMAGLTIKDLQKKRVGVAIGTTVGCAFNSEDYYRAFRQRDHPGLNPVIDYLNCNLAYLLQGILGIKGPSLVVTNACASGTDAIGIAGGWISSDLCDIAIAGGADELSRIAYNGFISLQLTDLLPCRPFDRDRQGLNLGEGAGIVFLEKGENVVKHRTSPLGWLRGYGVCTDAWHPTAPHPEGQGMVRAVKFAAEKAGTGLTFDLINAHGTATKANDVAETNALAALLVGHEETPIISTKGITGHTLGAAGGIEIILTVSALRRGSTRGTNGCVNVDPDFRVAPLPQSQKIELSGKIGLSQSLAFGGGNSALIVEAC